MISKSKIAKKSVLDPLLVLCTVFIGFRVILIGLVLVLVSLPALLWVRGYKARVHVAAIAVLIFYVLYCLLGLSNYEDGAWALVRHSIIFLLPSLLMVYLGALNSKFHLLVYSLVSLAFAYSVVIYSYSNGYPGYGELHNFLSGTRANSPGYVILILVSTLVCCEVIRGSQSMARYLALFALLFAAFIACSVYMQSRFSLIIIAVYLGYVFLFSFKAVLVSFLLLGLLFVVVDGGVVGLIDSLDRLNKSGLESPRWALWKYGFVEMFNQPFGGMKADAAGAGYQGIWFHNVYLDIARVSGLLVVFYWLLLQVVFLFIAIINLDKKDFVFYLAVFIFLSMAVFQDLAFEGFYNYMVYYFYLFGMAVSGSGRQTTLVGDYK